MLQTTSALRSRVSLKERKSPQKELGNLKSDQKRLTSQDNALRIPLFRFASQGILQVNTDEFLEATSASDWAVIAQQSQEHLSDFPVFNKPPESKISVFEINQDIPNCV
jgi:hypothetical protein